MFVREMLEKWEIFQEQAYSQASTSNRCSTAERTVAKTFLLCKGVKR